MNKTMKKYINVMLSVVMAGAVVSCSKDDPFDNYEELGYGKLLTTSLDVSLQPDGGPRSLKDRRIRAAAPAVDDFTVGFFRNGETEPVSTYRYAEMPEIVTLPVGDYEARAWHGTNPDAAWESPYYEGRSEFTIEKDVITDEVAPIKCAFSNVRVSITFTDDLKAAIEGDCTVKVNVGERGTLDFTRSHVDNGTSGYFAYVDDSQTLTATFSGIVDGVFTSESKTFNDVQPGRHYAIKFRLHDAGEEDPGDIDGDDIIVVDATVAVDDMNSNVDSSEGIIEDDMRPSEDFGDDPGKEDPSTPDNPSSDAITITATPPVDIDQENLLTEDLAIDLKIHSDEGIKEFTVKIDSNILTPDELAGVGLPPVMDLINPDDDIAGALGDDGFGFPIRDKVRNQHDVELSITPFVPMLLGVSQGNPAPYKYYNFILTVTDNKGNTTVKTLKLYNY